MTIPELIDSVLMAVRNQFYADRDREFMRDHRALTKAVSRYGYECHQRGWEFAVADIKRDLFQLLNEIKRTGSDVKFFPIYLESAVSRHIGQRAEELSVAGRKMRPKVDKIVRGAKVAVVIQPDNTEILAAVYRDVKRLARERRRAVKPKRHKEQQAELL